MGSKNSKSDNIKATENQIKYKINENPTINNLIIKDNILSKIPNPNFKNKVKFSNNECLNFEIYQLKNISNAYYMAFCDISKGIIIYKYFYGKKKFKMISNIKMDSSNLEQMIVKYFYNPINKEEYLFIAKSYNDIVIYLIQNESKFKLINKEETLINQFENDLRFSLHDISYIDLFEIFYNIYDKNIYVITIFYYGEDNDLILSNPNYISKTIKIQILKNDKLELLKEFTFDIKNSSDLLNLIYEDKYSKKYYILIIKDNIIKLIEIKQNDNSYQFINLIESENDLIELKKIFKKEYNYNACIINNDIKHLYINCKKIEKDEIEEDSNKIEDILIIVDLFKKKILKQIELPISANSIINWNDKKLIFISNKSFYIFDTNINKIISKYNIGEKNNICSIKTFFSEKNKFYSLFIHMQHIEYFIIK